MEIRQKVEGTSEVQSALNRVANFDVEKAGTDAARALLPDVRRFTRYSTGYLASGWDAESSQFINDVDYAVYQEFGTVVIDPTNAVQSSWDLNESAVIAAFEAEIDRAIAQT